MVGLKAIVVISSLLLIKAMGIIASYRAKTYIFAANGIDGFSHLAHRKKNR